MQNPYEGLTKLETNIVIEIAKAMGNGMLGEHNHTHPCMARRVFDHLRQNGLLVGFEPKPIEIQLISH